MATAPRYFDLGARDPSCAFSLADDTTCCTSDGCGVEIVDFDTGVKRPSTKADLARVTRLTDYLSSIAFWWPTVSAGDCGETAQLHELDAGWNNTVKHLQGFVQGEREARYAVEMATVIAGSAEQLRRRPVLSDLIGTDLAARAGRRRHRGGSRVRRGRRAGHLRHHADAGHHGAGHHAPAPLPWARPSS